MPETGGGSGSTQLGIRGSIAAAWDDSGVATAASVGRGGARGCRQDWRARRQSSACRTTGTATTAKTTDVVMSCRRPTSARHRRPPCRRFRLHHHSFSSIFKRYLFRGKPRENQHHLRWAAGTGNGGGGDGRQWQQQGDSPVVLLLHPPSNAHTDKNAVVTYCLPFAHPMDFAQTEHSRRRP